METQQQINFSRCEQLGLIENLRLPKLPKCFKKKYAASGQVCKHVLRDLDSFGRGGEAFPSIETMAERLDLSTRTVKRAIARLELLGLICKRKRKTRWGNVGNIYTIVWSELAVLQLRRSDPVSLGPAKRSDTGSERSDTVSKRSDTVSPEALKNENEAPPPTPTAAAGDLFDLLEAAGVRWQPKQLADRLRRDGWTVELLRQTCELVERNRGRLDNPPAALVGFLRHGSWPIEMDPVPTAEQLERSRRRKALKVARKIREDVIYETRRQPDDVRQAAIREAIPAELLAVIESEEAIA